MKKITPKDHNCHILLLVLLTLVHNVFMKLYNVHISALRVLNWARVA